MKRMALVALVWLCGMASHAFAAEGLALTAGDYRTSMPPAPWLMAATEESGSAVVPAGGPLTTMTEEPFEESWFTLNKTHQYLGLGSLALATMALLAPKEENGPHEYFARGAAALGGAAVASGLVIHWDDIGLSLGIMDPDNQHALLGTLGALGFLAAVAAAPDEGHVAAGVGGFAAMALAIRLTW